MSIKQYFLVLKTPKVKEIGIGFLNIDQNGEATFFEGDVGKRSRVLALLRRVRIEWAAASGIMISGMQPDGFTPKGTPKFVYQEWFLRYEQHTHG
jgi:hypothetical protein